MNRPARYLLTAIILACLAAPTTAFCKKKKKGKGTKETTEQAQVVPSSPPTAAPTSAPPQISGNLTTTSGKTFEAVTVKRVDPDGLLILHKDGAAKVLFTELSDELQAKYGYDEAKAKAFQAGQAASKLEAVAAEAEKKAVEQRNQEQAKQALKIQGKVIQVVKEGIILRVDPWEGRTKGRPPLLMGGADYIFVVGHSRQGAKVDGDTVDVDAYPSGVFSYANTLGAARRLKQYQVIKTFR
jgi:hypothetical protein